MSTEKQIHAQQQSDRPDRAVAPVASNQPQENLVRLYVSSQVSYKQYSNSSIFIS
jgi:hypothetical protein